MSIANLLTSQNQGNDQSYLNITVNDLNVDGTFTASGSIVTSGNITVSNTNPSISILQNSNASVNNSTLILRGKPSLNPLVLQQINNGDANLVNFNPNSSLNLNTNGSGAITLATGTGNVNLVPQGTAHVALFGSSAYPAGDYYLGLSGNQVVNANNFALSTFTPVLSFGGSTTGITYVAGSNVGKYQKIGKTVFFNFSFTLTSTGSATGVAAIDGFPIASSSISPPNNVFIMGYNANIGVGAGSMVGGYFQSSSTKCDLSFVNTGGAITAMSEGDFVGLPNGSSIYANGFYFTD